MADVFSPETRSAIMSRIRSKGNESTERRLIGIMRKGCIAGWRRHQPLPGRPDFVFPKDKVAVFADGCFWHGCPLHGRKPTSNEAYWLPKLERNKRRDRRVNRELRAAGWTVIRFWQHDLAAEPRVLRRLQAAFSRAQKLLHLNETAVIKP